MKGAFFMNEYLFGLGFTIVFLMATYVMINIVFPYFKKCMRPRTSYLIFSPCDSKLSHAGDGDDGNSEEQFKNVLNHLSLSKDSEVVVFEKE